MNDIIKKITKEMDLANYHKELPTAYYKDIERAINLTTIATTQKIIELIKQFRIKMIKEEEHWVAKRIEELKKQIEGLK